MSQSLEQGKRKLTAKDAITAGALGAVCIAIRFVFMLVGGVSPYVWFATHLIDAILIGPVFMLMVAKVRKNGPFLLTSLVTGVVLVAATWMFPITGLVGGLLCELCLRAGQFRQKSWLVLGFFCFNLGFIGDFLPLWFTKESYLEYAAQMMDAGYMATMEGLLTWPVFGIIVLSILVGSILGALLGMIPQGLVLLTSSVLAIATVRLARRKVLAQQLYCIETLARVDVLCLDKTGTITSGRMEVEGTYPLPVEGMGAGESDAAVPVDTTVLDFALANVARATSADANETCQALLNYYADRPVEVSEPLSVIPFSSSKKWSGASFAQGSYVMGAAQFVLSERAFSQVENRVAELADTCRVLVVARVDGFTPDGDMVGEAEPVGFVTIRDEIRTSAAETIGYFNEQGVTLNVISGDDPRTVSSIARVVGVPGADAYVDATTLDTPAKLDAAVDRYHVFGRVTPQQKRELVQALKRRAHTVAMTGDGVNDVLALKEADCSVAMAAGSDAARNVAEIVLVDNDFASMPAVVAEGRRSINNLQRSASLFLTKTLFSMGLAALCIALPPYPFEPIQMTLINFFCIGAPGFVLGLEPNNARVKGSFLTNVLKRALPASLAVILAAALDIFVARVFGFNQLTPSTMCLLTSCAASVSLIWRISQPLTPLRVALFVFVVAGILTGVIGFPKLLSIANLSMGQMVILAVIVVITCSVFFKLATMMDSLKPRRRHAATGFGRGVRVRLGRGGGKVSSTGSTAERFAKRVAADMAQRREARTVREAEARALEGVAQAQPKKKKSTGVKRSRVTKSAQGIKVSMPSKKKK